ncbi:MAG TPA: hypothetical protein VEB03_01405 [Candidatus Nanoarchaeia archaeon]|nr:hypothetical protein [Candidatus Nanoarchaeia archaeon]
MSRSTRLIGCLMVLCGWVLVGLAAEAGISVSFKLDPRLTSSLYMGERWVSPPTYTAVQRGAELTVDARAQVFDGHGRVLEITPTWRAEHEDVVRIITFQDNRVRFLVHRAGETRIVISGGGFMRRLRLKAEEDSGRLKVSFAPE